MDETPATPVVKPRHHRLRWILGGVLGSVAALVAVLLIMLATAADRAVVIRDAVGIANRVLAGHIELGTAWLFPNGHFVAHDVVVRDPQGNVVVRAETIDTHVDLKALAHQHLHLTQTHLLGGELLLATDAEGHLNIAEAFTPKHPSPASSEASFSSGGGGLTIDIDRADLHLDQARFTQGAAASPDSPLTPLVDLEQTVLVATMSLDRAGALHVEAQSLRGNVLAPVKGPLALAATLDLDGSKLKATAQGSLDDAELKAHADLDLATLKGQVVLADASVGPRVLATWLSDLDPQGARVNATLALDGQVLQLQALHLTPLDGAGELDGSGTLDLSKGDAEVHLAAHDLDTRSLLGRLPSTMLGLTVEASGTDVFHDGRRGQGHLDIAASIVEKQRVGPGAVDAQVEADTLELTSVDVAFPGGRVRGSGTISQRRIAAKARVEAPDLAALRAALEGLLDVNLPDFAGRLSSDVAIEGPWLHPAVRAEVRAPHLTLDGFEGEGVEAHLVAARLGSPMNLKGRVTISQLHAADHLLHDVGLSVLWVTPDLHLDVHASERGRPIAILANLAVPPSLQSADLTFLKLHIAGGDWTLERPAAIDFRSGVAFEGIELRSDPQRLSVSLSVGPHTLKGSVEVVALDLSRMPAALLPSLELQGHIQGSANYEEQGGKATGHADLQVAHVAVRGLEVPSGRVVAKLEDSKVVVDLSAKLAHGQITATGSSPLTGKEGPIQAQLTASAISMDDFVGIEPRLKKVHGILSGEAQITGEWAAPRLTLSGSATQLTGSWTQDPEAGVLAAPLDVNLTAELGLDELKEDLTVRAGDKPICTIDGTARLGSRKVGHLLTGPPDLVAQLKATEIDQRFTVDDVTAEPLLRAASAGFEIEGTFSAKGWIHGTIRAPRGDLALDGHQLIYENHPLGELHLQLAATDSGFNGHAELHPSQGELVATLAWLLAPEQILDAKTRLGAKLTGDAHVTGLPLATALGSDTSLKGLAELTASFRGSLAAPTGQAQVSLHDLQLATVPVGSLEARGTWSGTKLVATLTGSQPQGGRLDGHAELPLALGRQAPDQPVSATLVAKGFELAPLSALVAQTGATRGFAGRLDSELALKGTRASPVATGSLTLSGGKVALAGYGEFSDVQAQLHLDDHGAQIDRISGKSAGGSFLVKGTLRPSASSGLAVQTHIDTDSLGIYQSDRLLGYLTSNEDLTGNVGSTSTKLTLAIHRALLTLPELVPKSTAPTSLDSDIVLGARPPPRAKTDDSYAIRLEVVAPSGLEVKATDLDLKARADLALVVQGDAEMRGGVYVTEGEVHAYGRQFKVEHASVTFGQGTSFGPAASPMIDARAMEVITPYRLYIDVSGTPSTIQIASSSEPPLNEEQVGDLLVSGSASGIRSSPGSLASQEGGQVAASALGGFLSEKLRQSLGAYMPLDVLTVEPARVEAGKNLTPRFYVGAVENGGINDPRINSAEIHANYKLSDQWAIDSRYGTAQAGNLDLQWSHSW